MIRGIVFDMDGLLFDSERLVKRTWNEVGEILGLPGLGEHIRHTLGKNRRGRNEYFIRAFGENFPFEAFDRENKRIFAGIMEREGMPVKPGARELLAYGKEQGYKMGIATSSSRNYAVEHLKGTGLYEYFDGGVFGDMVTRGKPDPEIYLRACRALGTEPAHTLAVEDSRNGILSASRAGMQVIMVPDMIPPTPELEALLFRRCGDLHQVQQLLANIL